MNDADNERFQLLMAEAQRDESIYRRRSELRRARLREMLGREPTLSEEIAAIYAESRLRLEQEVTGTA